MSPSRRPREVAAAVTRTPSESAGQSAGPGQLTLPFWPDHLRGLPRAAIWSALFAPLRRGARTAVTRAEIAAVNGFNILYTGFRLDQTDLDVFAHCVQLATGRPLGERISFRTRDMLRSLGRSTGKSDREWLLRSLSRLQACAVEIRRGATSYSGSLIAEQARNDDEGVHYLVLNPRLADLYALGYGSLRWADRRQLAGRPLALWLHAFLCELRGPLSFHTADLMRYAGSGYGRARDFRANLEAAANEVAKVMPLTLTWSSKGDTVTFARGPSATAIPPSGR